MWEVEYKKTFLKELKKLPRDIREEAERIVFHTLPHINSLSEIPHIEKLKGYKAYYRIRLGSYRIGMRVSRKQKRIELYRVLHRKDLYRFFP